MPRGSTASASPPEHSDDDLDRPASANAAERPATTIAIMTRLASLRGP